MRLGEEATSGWTARAFLYGGLVIGVVWLLGLLARSQLGPLKVIGQSVTCQANLMQQLRAAAIYAEDYQGGLPLASAWMDTVSPYLDRPSRLHCPAVSEGTDERYGYALNRAVAGRSRPVITASPSVVMIFESDDLSRNAAGSPAGMMAAARHSARMQAGAPLASGDFVAYASGAVKLVRARQKAQ